jgi:hypothetical protein
LIPDQYPYSIDTSIDASGIFAELENFILPTAFQLSTFNNAFVQTSRGIIAITSPPECRYASRVPASTYTASGEDHRDPSASD